METLIPLFKGVLFVLLMIPPVLFFFGQRLEIKHRLSAKLIGNELELSVKEWNGDGHLLKIYWLFCPGLSISGFTPPIELPDSAFVMRFPVTRKHRNALLSSRIMLVSRINSYWSLTIVKVKTMDAVK